ncbi:MSC_0775 family lipoprotein [Mesomycoplasma hyorhinis]|uniref:MSC_0775 family lipoprotein n=1 Tax=Mesomycoplasma hyorhinis TaxID=2100 RepID=UPI001C05C952|nr:hypothetical protein [Mesomycoplasma hyorhinis]
MNKQKLFKSFALILTPAVALSSFISCFSTDSTNVTNNFLDSTQKGNSIYIPQYQLGTFLEQKLDQFVNVSYIQNNVLDQSEVLISNFKKNLLPHKYLQINVDQFKLINAVNKLNDTLAQNKKININNFSYEIEYSQVKENDRDTSVLDVPVNIRYFDPSENNKWKREQDFVIIKQVPGFKIDEEKQKLINKVLKLDMQSNKENAQKFDFNDKSKYSTLSFVKLLRSKEKISYKESLVPEEQTKDKTLEKTKFLDKNIQDIFLVDQNGKEDLIFNLPTIDEGVNYYLKDVKVADDDFSKIEITLRGVAVGEKNNFASLDLHFTIASDNNNKFKNLTDEEFLELSKEKLNVRLKNHLSFINYPWDKANVNDFEITSKNSKYNASIVQVLEKSQETRSAKLAIKFTNNKQNPSQEPIYFAKTVGLPKHLELFNREDSATAEKLNKPERVHLTIPELPRENLLQITNSVNELANSFATPGGYQEFRTFYTNTNFTAALHIGEDVLVDAGMILKTFAKSKIISAYALETNVPGSGIGAQVAMEVQVKDLDIDQSIKDNQLRNVDSLIFFFIHLDPSFLSQLGTVTTETISNRKYQIVKNITPQTPKYLAKGQPFAKIGTTEVNGGWTPHTHIEVYPVYYEVKDGKKQEVDTFLNWDYIPVKFSSLRVSSQRFKDYDKNPSSVKVVGVKTSTARRVATEFNKDGTAKSKPSSTILDRDYINNIREEFNKLQALNPNWIFQFRTNNQSTVRLESLYSEANK